ncbi:hypothetical protein GWR56_09020 [Mucilaginibacter sp. 14171R-50]|uniref:hypothetical protein n=1 Tax=Mucilaginibacter sp. 14171R-50 TaxID=2703789 RepID=UPI00138DC895|nr:hypothetical protein [Mucilaginibacter sp. 14171R-50]QHS55672.1 hypothetical protein GWR56_09020 [Mucilaginibacter sp. 14171R-50]
MIKNFTKAIFSMLLISAIAGCKLDAPVYPEGTVANEGVDDGNNNGNTASGRTITYTIDGKTTTLKSNVVFQVYTADQFPPDGAVQIGGGTDASNLFTLMAPITGTGTFDISGLAAGTTLIGDAGKVTVTQYNVSGSNKGTIVGTFTGDLVDISNGADKTVSGSFSIKM